MYPPDHDKEPCTCTTFHKCPYHAERDRKSREENAAYKKRRRKEMRRNGVNPEPTMLDTIDDLVNTCETQPYHGNQKEVDGMVVALKRLRESEK